MTVEGGQSDVNAALDPFADFEDEGRGPEPQNVRSHQALEKGRDRSLPGASRRGSSPAGPGF